jgi:hypothetical protein
LAAKSIDVAAPKSSSRRGRRAARVVGEERVQLSWARVPLVGDAHVNVASVRGDERRQLNRRARQLNRASRAREKNFCGARVA